MKKYSLIYIICICLGISACELNPLSINVEPAETQLAIASYVVDSLLVVSVSKSFSALSAEDVDNLTEDLLNTTLVDRGLVTTQYSGRNDTLDSIEELPGIYFISLETLDPFQDIQISVFDSTTELSVRANTQLIPGVRFDSTFVSIEIEDDDSTTTVYFDFTDPEPGIENFYVFHAYNYPELEGLELNEFLLENVFLPSSGTLLYERLLTDRSADTDSIGREVVLPQTAIGDSVVYVLSNIDEGYYRFLEARSRSGGLLSSLSNEPVNHPTNVEGGLGYFSAHQPRSRIVGTTFVRSKLSGKLD